MRTTRKLTFSLTPDLDSLAALSRRLAWEFETAEIPGRSRHACELVIEELIANVIRHGGEATSTIDLCLEIEDDELVITVRDDGQAFDPTSGIEAHRPRSLADLRVGGLGLPMVRKATRSLAYRRERGLNLTEARVANQT